MQCSTTHESCAAGHTDPGGATHGWLCSARSDGRRVKAGNVTVVRA
jgi:hypothetical protein